MAALGRIQEEMGLQYFSCNVFLHSVHGFVIKSFQVLKNQTCGLMNKISVHFYIFVSVLYSLPSCWLSWFHVKALTEDQGPQVRMYVSTKIFFVLEDGFRIIFLGDIKQIFKLGILKKRIITVALQTRSRKQLQQQSHHTKKEICQHFLTNSTSLFSLILLQLLASCFTRLGFQLSSSSVAWFFKIPLIFVTDLLIKEIIGIFCINYVNSNFKFNSRKF